MDPRATGTHQPAAPPKEKALTAALVAAGTVNPSPAPETMPALKAGRQGRKLAPARAVAWNQTWAPMAR